MIPSPGRDSKAAEFRLLDVTVRLVVPTDAADLLIPYPAGQVGQRAPDLQVVVRELDLSGEHWEVEGDIHSTCSAAELAGTLLSAVNIGVLDRTQHLAVHSGVVGVKAGAVAFPGSSGAGKSTLTAACVLRGFTYVSDEALCLDPGTELVQPFLRPLALSAESLRLIGLAQRTGPVGPEPPERVLTAGELGGSGAEGPLPLAHVVLATRHAGTAALTSIPRRHAVTALLAHAFNHYRMPDAAFDVVYRVVAAAQVWRLTYSDPLDGADLLRDRLSEES